MGSVAVRNDMPTNPIVDAVGCLSCGGDGRHGGASPALQDRPRLLTPLSVGRQARAPPPPLSALSEQCADHESGSRLLIFGENSSRNSVLRSPMPRLRTGRLKKRG